MVRTVGAVAVTDELLTTVLERLTEGMTLKQSCQESKISYSNAVRRIGDSSSLKQLHARVREEYIRRRVGDMHDIASNPDIDPARARIMIDVIKWESARVLPKEFGDRVQQEVIITNNTTLSQRMHAARNRATKAVVTDLPPTTEGES